MLINLIRKLVRDRKGGTAIEYGLIAALIVITMIAAFVDVANKTTSMWYNVHNTIETSRNG